MSSRDQLSNFNIDHAPYISQLSYKEVQARVQVIGLPALLMADREQGDGGEDECVNAFKSGNKHVAEQLLSHTRPADVRTTFEFRF